ncbi:MAG: WG repeat-containing protein [Moraxella sp.]|nr:WG repeat-containing protein [Moraxella sp.]
MKKPNLHKLPLSIALVGVVVFGSSVWACERPQVSGYNVVYCSSEGLTKVWQNGKYGFIDKTGKAVIPVQYDFAWEFSEGLARVEQNDKYGFIDKTGKAVIPVQYDFAWEFSEGLAKVKLNGETFYIDKTGKRRK